MERILKDADRPAPATVPWRLYIDCTRLVTYRGQAYGILRVAKGITGELCRMGVGRPVAWSKTRREFIEFPAASILDGTWKEAMRRQEARFRRPRLKEGDFLLEPACHWWENDEYMEDLIRLVRGNGLALFQYVPDVVWYLMPHLSSDDDYVSNCINTTSQMLSHASAAVTYSRASARDIAQFCRDKNLGELPIAVCNNADKFPDDVVPAAAGVEQTARFPDFVLCVSSMQRRKNYPFLLSLWRRLLEEFGSESIPGLVCVAYGSQEGERIKNEVARDPVLRDHVLILNRLSDGEVLWLYDNCMFTVFPSLYEGWGLPVGESLGRRKICIASNASSIPEIAPDYTDLLDPLDFASWYARLKTYIFDSRERARREKEIGAYKPRTWHDTAEQLVSQISYMQNCGILNRNGRSYTAVVSQ